MALLWPTWPSCLQVVQPSRYSHQGISGQDLRHWRASNLCYRCHFVLHHPQSSVACPTRNLPDCSANGDPVKFFLQTTGLSNRPSSRIATAPLVGAWQFQRSRCSSLVGFTLPRLQTRAMATLPEVVYGQMMLLHQSKSFTASLGSWRQLGGRAEETVSEKICYARQVLVQGIVAIRRPARNTYLPPEQTPALDKRSSAAP